ECISPIFRQVAFDPDSSIYRNCSNVLFVWFDVPWHLDAPIPTHVPKFFDAWKPFCSLVPFVTTSAPTMMNSFLSMEYLHLYLVLKSTRPHYPRNIYRGLPR